MYCPKIFHNYGISHVCFVRFCIKRINQDDWSKSLVLILNSWVSEGSVLTQFRWEWNLYHRHVDTFLGSPTVKEFCKLVYFCQNYDTSQVSIFWDSVLLYYLLMYEFIIWSFGVSQQAPNYLLMHFRWCTSHMQRGGSSFVSAGFNSTFLSVTK